MKKYNPQHYILAAYYFWRKEKPLPVDLQANLLRCGYSYEMLKQEFEDGYTPENYRNRRR